MAQPDLALLGTAVGTPSSAIVALWLAASAGLAFLGRKSPQFKSIPNALFFHAGSLALTYVLLAVAWQQTTGDFVPFAEAWPSALAMGVVLSFFFVAFVNLQGRTSAGLSVFALVAFTILGSVFFAFGFFVLPRLVRPGLELSGFI